MRTKQQVNSYQSEQRRRFHCFPLHLSVEVRRDDLPGAVTGAAHSHAEGAIRLEVRDLALAGLHCASDVALRCGEAVTMSRPSLASRARLAITGRVISCDLVDEQFNVAIAFCQTSDALKSSPWLRLPELFCLTSTRRSPSGRLVQ
jgi:hypothetical protein